MTIGMDLGDKTSRYCVLGRDGRDGGRQVATTKKGMTQMFADAPVPDRDGSGNAFAVGEPVVEEPGI